MEKHIYDALKILIDLSKEAQENQKQKQKYFSFKEWINEYCTIKVCSSRRTGHTEAIRRLIFEDEMNIGYFSSNHSQVREFLRVYNIKKKDNQKGKLVFYRSVNDDIRKVYLSSNFFDLDAIVVDGDFYLSERKKVMLVDISLSGLLPSLYDHVPPRTKPFYFIFLQ